MRRLERADPPGISEPSPKAISLSGYSLECFKRTPEVTVIRLAANTQAAALRLSELLRLFHVSGIHLRYIHEDGQIELVVEGE